VFGGAGVSARTAYVLASGVAPSTMMLQHARTTPDDVRSMMRDACERLATAREAGAEKLGDGPLG
jgi:hypothetical protein